MKKQVRTILIGLSIFAAVLLGVFIIYTVNKPAPTPTPTPTATPEPVEINEVTPPTDVCALTFTVQEELVPGLACIDKELYKDDSANEEGDYDLSADNKLDGTHKLVPGETYVYVISYENTGNGATTGKVEDILPTGLTYKDGEDGCTYTSANRKIVCEIESVSPDQAGTKAFRFTVNANIDTSKSVKNSATVVPTVGDESICEITNPVKTPTPSTTPSTTPSATPSTPASATPTPSPNLSAELDCVVKRAYEDDSRNTAGTYYLNNEIVDTNTLSNGDTIVYNIVVENRGDAAVSDTTIDDVLSSNLTFVDASSGCNYDSASRKVSCAIGSLPANTETSKSIRVKIAVAGTASINNRADVYSTNGQRDICELKVTATGVIEQPPSPVPSTLPEAGIFELTAGTLGIGVLLLLLGALGLLLI